VVRRSAKMPLVKRDRADFKAVEGAGFQNADEGYLGGFDALRLIRLVFRGFVELSRSDRVLVVAREGGAVAPLGLGIRGGMEPSAHALGYRLTARRA
jgi:hypothetical protein